jgi:hypothetical protein
MLRGPFEVELGLLLPDGKVVWGPHGRFQVPAMKRLHTEVPEESVDAAGCPLQRPAPRRQVP